MMGRLRDTELSFLKYYIPISVDVFLSLFTEFVAAYFSARIGADYYVTGAGIAAQVTMSTLWAILYGYSSVFECYAGALKKLSGRRALGVLLLKCTLQGVLVFLLFVLPFLSSCWIVPLFGTDENVHRIAVLCIKLICFRPLLIYFRDLLVKYLVSQDHVVVCLVSTAVCVPLSVAMVWFTVVYQQWGIYGLAAAQYGTVLISLLLLILFTVWNREELCFPHISSLTWADITQGWGEMFKLGIFSGLRTFASFALSAIAAVVCQSSGETTAAANVVIFIAVIVLNSTVHGGAYAQALIVGESLGRGNKEDVKFAMKLGMVNLVVDRVVVTIIFLSVIEPISRLLSQDEAVIREVVDANGPVIAMIVLFGLDEYLSRGILVPFARQALVAVVTPASIYLIAVPLLVAMVRIYQVPVSGVILCETSSYLVQCVVYITKLCTSDVTREIERCRERNTLTDIPPGGKCPGGVPVPSPLITDREFSYHDNTGCGEESGGNGGGE